MSYVVIFTVSTWMNKILFRILAETFLYGHMSRLTWYCTHTGLQPFLKIGFVVTGGEFYSYYIHQVNKSDKERKM